MNYKDTTSWTESTVRVNGEECFNALKALNYDAIRELRDGEYFSALGAMSYVEIGAEKMRKAGLLDARQFIAELQYYMGAIMVCAVYDYSYSSIAEDAVPKLEEAAPWLSSEKAYTARQAAYMLRRGEDLNDIQSRCFPNFPSDMLDGVYENHQKLKELELKPPEPIKFNIFEKILFSVIAVVIVAVVVTSLFGNPKKPQSSGSASTATQAYSSAADAGTDAVEEKPTSAPTEKPTSAPAEKPTSAPTEPPTAAPTKKSESPAAGNVFSQISRRYILTSGRGGWATYLTVYDDGSFDGEYYNINSDGTSKSVFRGTFGDVVGVNDTTYSMRILSLTYDYAPGTTSFNQQDGNVTYTTAYGLENAGELIVYTPSTPVSELSSGYTWWLVGSAYPSGDTLGKYGIYNVSEDMGFMEYSN